MLDDARHLHPMTGLGIVVGVATTTSVAVTAGTYNIWDYPPT
jgi:hypothetical protein